MATKPVKLAILRARHDTSVPYISDAACIAMFMTNADRRSVLNFWEAVTDSYLQFDGSSLMPWVDITLDPADTSRRAQVAKAYEAARALPGAVLDGFDGFVVLTWPGTVQMPNPDADKPGQPATVPQGIDSGAGPVVAGKPACALPVMGSNHTFCCHEVGHVLGFGHTYGVWNNGIDWDGKPPFDQGQVYGDPYDVMSSAAFGTRNLDPTLSAYFANPTFAGPAVPDWPNPGAFSMGPEPARAHVHLWDPRAVPENTVRHVPSPVGGGAHRARLMAAGRHSGGTSLLVVHPADEDAEGRGRCYVEYRESTRWDQGLDLSGTDLARQAVVVHTLADATGDGVRCWYRGRILVPLEADTDLVVEGTPLVVRVLDADTDAGAVEVEISLSAPREVSIDVRNYEALLDVRDPQEMGTPCGDTIVSATRIWQTTSHYTPVTRGFGGFGAPDVVSPVLTWTVGGTVLAAGTGSVDVAYDDAVFAVDYELDAATGRLVLVARGGERYTADVSVTATEPGGGDAVTAVERFDPVGWTTGYTAADLAKLDRCMTERFQRVFVRPRDWLVPPDPDPLRPGVNDRINEARLRVLADAVARFEPTVARDMSRIAALRYQPTR